jgi:butyryl-CoA dehydrogenase
MPLDWTEDQKILRSTVQKLAMEKLAPQAAEIDQEAAFPRENVKIMAELGLFGLTVPEKYGGSGMDNVTACMAIEELSRGCFGTAAVLATHFLALTPILLAGSEEQKGRVLPPCARGDKIGAFGLTEPEAGSDVVSMITTAALDGDAYILNGMKHFISNAGEAETYVVFAKTDKTKGYQGISAFIVEKGTAGFEFGKKDDKMGMRGCPNRELIFTDCRVPKANRLGDLGGGFKIAMMTLDETRTVVASEALGIAQACLDAALDYARKRIQFGQPLVKFQAIQFYLADMATDLVAARLLVYDAARMVDRKRSRYTKESAMAKLLASEMLNRVVDKALQIHGGYGYMKEFPVERYYRDARLLRIIEGTSEVQKMVISSEMMRA